jgi:hypothetical protein
MLNANQTSHTFVNRFFALQGKHMHLEVAMLLDGTGATSGPTTLVDSDC